MPERFVTPTAARLLTAMLAIAAVVVSLLASARPVGAHSGEGALQIIGVQQGPEQDQVRLSAAYRYDDEHAVYRDGTLRVAGSSSEGVTLIPRTLSRTDVDGLYVVDVELPPPGIWTVRVEGTSPRATAEISFDTADPQWLEPDEAAAAPDSTGSGPQFRWDWMLLGFAAVAGWFLVLRWRRGARKRVLSDSE